MVLAAGAGRVTAWLGEDLDDDEDERAVVEAAVLVRLAVELERDLLEGRL